MATSPFLCLQHKALFPIDKVLIFYSLYKKNTPLHLHCLFTGCGLRSVPLISQWDNHRPLIWSGPPGWGLAKVSHQQFPVVIDFAVVHQYSRDLMLVSAGPGPVYLASCTAHTNAAELQSADFTWAFRTMQKKMSPDLVHGDVCYY